MSIWGGSPGFAYPASRLSPGTLDWPTIGTDPRDDIWREGTSISNRSWHLWRNNAYARAMVKTMVEGVLGAKGVTPRSIYRGDTGIAMSKEGQQDAKLLAVRKKREAIERSLEHAWIGRRFDAQGSLTKREMSETMLISCMVSGNAWAIRQWKPNRPGRQYQATCWRIIDPSRVSNPNYGVNTATLFEGVKLDSDGCPIGIYIQRRNPYAVQVVNYTWDFVPWYDQQGNLNVVHLKAPGRADSILGVGWFDSIMGLVNQLGAVTDAHVTAKRVQACIGTIETSPNPAAHVTGMTNGATSQAPPGAAIGRMYPGMRLTVPLGTTVTTLNWGFQGSDHMEFQDSMLQSICAAWGLPMEYVQHRLTKTNMAAARAALMQAYRTFAYGQEMLIGAVEAPWAESVVTEDLARDRLSESGLAADEDMDDVFAFRWNRPAKHYPDPVKEETAAAMAIARGKSPSSIAAEMGDDFEAEVLQSHQDFEFADVFDVKVNGVELQATDVTANGDEDDDGSVNKDKSSKKKEAKKDPA